MRVGTGRARATDIEEWRDWSCAVTVTTSVVGDLEPAVAIVRAVMSEVEAAASRFRADSDLSRINAHAGRDVPVTPLTIRLVAMAVDAARRTDGAVTPTVGAGLVAQGYDADIDVVRARTRIPCTAPITSPAPEAGEVIRIDRGLGRIGVRHGTVLDLGALAKAYAVDEALQRIADRRLGPALVSIGGDLGAVGEHEWQVAVSETADVQGQLVTISSGAVATSSTAGRRWGGGRHHIIDPRTGGCAAGRWRTATLWAPTAVEANTLSTWALVDADAHAVAVAVRRRPARYVDGTGTVIARHGWPAEANKDAS